MPVSLVLWGFSWKVVSPLRRRTVACKSRLTTFDQTQNQTLSQDSNVHWHNLRLQKSKTDLLSRESCLNIIGTPVPILDLHFGGIFDRIFSFQHVD